MSESHQNMFTNLKSLIKLYSIDDIESHCFKLFLTNEKLNYFRSSIFTSYFENFSENIELMDQIKLLNLSDFSQLETLMELLIPQEDRRINGAFFTPSFIVQGILSELKPERNSKILDPSCGCGAFLIGVVKYYMSHYSCSIKSILNHIYGVDILEYNIKRTKLLIATYALYHNELIDEDDFNLKNADTLKYTFENKFDYVIGNPPYVKYQDLSNENRVFLIENFQSISKGTFNLYFAFFEKGYELLNDTGKLGYITPNNFFTSLAGEPLRTYFTENKSIFKILDFNHTKVFDAQTYTCITFLSRQNSDVIQFDKLFDKSPIDFLSNTKLSHIPLNELSPKKWRLLRDEERVNIKKMETVGTQLKDLFVINVGIATLKDSLFIVDYNDGGYFKKVNGQLIELEEESLKSLYKISTFKDQNEILKNKKKIIFPYQIVNNRAELLDEEYMKSNFPNTWTYLSSIKEKLVKRGKKYFEPFYMYGRSQGLNKFGIRLLTPTFSQYPKFLLVDEVDSLYCNGYGLHFVPEEENISLFTSNAIKLEKNILLLQRILNSHLMHYYVKNTSVSIQGGYPCYQKNFIERFCVPNLSQDQVDYLIALNDEDFRLELNNLYGVKI